MWSGISVPFGAYRKPINHMNDCVVGQAMTRIGRMVLKSSATDDTKPEDGIILGKSLAMDHRKVIVARDAAHSSAMMACAVTAGLLFQGADVVDMGILSAPAAAMCASYGDCAVYIAGRQNMISGYYLMNRDGSLFTDQQVRHLDIYFQSPPVPPDHTGLGRYTVRNGVTEEYNQRIVDLLRGDIRCPIIADCVCGTASESLPQILNRLGADVMTVDAQRDPGFTGPSDGKDSIGRLEEMVANSPGSIGIRVNGIGTLAEIVDEKGSLLPMEKVFALIVLYMRPKSIAVTVSSPSLIEEVFLHGCDTDVETPFPERPEKDRSIVLTDDSAAAVCEAVVDGADLGYYHGSIVFGGGAAFGDGVRAAAVIGQMAGDNSLHAVSECLPTYLREEKARSCDMDAETFRRAFEKASADLKDRITKHGNVFRATFDSGWFIVKHRARLEGGFEIDTAAESDDRAYLACLTEMADSLVDAIVGGRRRGGPPALRRSRRPSSWSCRRAGML